jgi:hypothetical protein
MSWQLLGMQSDHSTSGFGISEELYIKKQMQFLIISILTTLSGLMQPFSA